MTTKVLCGERVFPIPARNTKRLQKKAGGASGNKGPNCKTDATKKFYLCNPKAVKRKDYMEMVAKYIKKAGG